MGIRKDREKLYGPIEKTGEIWEGIMASLYSGPGFASAPPVVKYALSNIAGKFARAANGDWTHLDGWEDVLEYVRTIRDAAEKVKGKGEENAKTS